MTRRRIPSLIVLAALVIVAGACSASGASPSSGASAAAATLAPVELSGTSWTLATIDGATSAAAKVTLEFRADGTAGGSAGCNSYNGTYAVEGTSLTFGALLSTKMACEQPTMTLESTYLTALEGVTGFGVDASGNLVLSGTSDLTFTRA